MHNSVSYTIVNTGKKRFVEMPFHITPINNKFIEHEFLEK